MQTVFYTNLDATAYCSYVSNTYSMLLYNTEGDGDSGVRHGKGTLKGILKMPGNRNFSMPP